MWGTTRGDCASILDNIPPLRLSHWYFGLCACHLRHIFLLMLTSTTCLCSHSHIPDLLASLLGKNGPSTPYTLPFGFHVSLHCLCQVTFCHSVSPLHAPSTAWCNACSHVESTTSCVCSIPNIQTSEAIPILDITLHCQTSTSFNRFILCLMFYSLSPPILLISSLLVPLSLAAPFRCHCMTLITCWTKLAPTP